MHCDNGVNDIYMQVSMARIIPFRYQWCYYHCLLHKGMLFSLSLSPPSPHTHNVSFPFRTLQRLPNDLLGALDLDYLLTPTQHPHQLTIPSLVVDTPPRHTTQALLRDNILTFQRVYSGSGMSHERIIAKALVDYVLHSSQKRLVPPIFTFGADPHAGSSLLNTKRAFLSVNNSTDGVMEWRETKRNSSGSIRGLKEGATCKSASGVSMDSEGYGSASTDYSDFPRTERRKVSFHVGGEPAAMSMDIQEEVDEEELRIVAKKLVMKILHMACKEVESLNRRSSIEYLIASTKRIKIEESPSPPPVLFNIAEEQDGVDPSNGNIPNPFSELRSGPAERSPTPEHLRLRRLGKKRGRSGSHEVSALREFIETSRRSKVVRKIINFKERIMGGFQQPTSAGGSVKSPTKSNDDSSSQSGDEGTSFTSLISNMSRMSIGPPQQHESDTESEATSINDESFTILSAVTVSEDPLAGLRDDTTGNTSKRFPFQDVHASSHQRSNHVGPLGAASPFNVTLAHNTSPSPLATQSSSTTSPLINSSCGTRNHTEDSIVPNMDLFVIVHSRPSLSKCQKFLCSNTNEVNLMYHCWMYPNVPFDLGMSVSGKLEMGVFEPSFVEPVHLDLQDAGIAFYFLDERYIV